MSRLLAMLLCGSLLGAGAARAADNLEPLRAQVGASQERVAGLLKRQAELRANLNQVSAEVEALKKRRGLLNSPQLDAALRRSQELAASLTTVAKNLSAEQAQLHTRSVALAGLLRAEVRAEEELWERSASRATRRVLLDRMRGLRAELGQLEASQPNSTPPQVTADVSSENPVDLLEQADALRDAQDKARAQIQLLDARIRDARDEHEMDRRMDEFAKEDDLFEEQVHELRVTGGAAGAVATPSASFGKNLQGTPSATTAVPQGGALGHPTTPGTPTGAAPATGQDHRPELDTGTVGSAAVEAPGDVKALEQRRRQLQGLVQELEQRVRSTESRAHALQ